MTPTQTFDNFPEFANAGTKTQPNDAKYAQGFLPQDVLPAEWLNYFLAGSTKGITALNTGVASVETEINTVLASRNEEPNASSTNQLLTVLNKIKAEAILAAHPVDSLYWTSSNENPAITFGGGTWTQIKDKFVWAKGDSDTVNATGGSKTKTIAVENLPSHSHSFTPSGSISVTTNPTFTGTAVASGVNNRGHTHGYSHTHGYTPSGKIASTSGGTDNKTATESSHTHTINNGNTSSSGIVTTAGIRHSGTTGAMNQNETHTHSLHIYSEGGIGDGGTKNMMSGGSSTATSIDLDSSRCYAKSTSVAHTHNLPTSYIYGNTDSGSAHSHTAYFTGTAGTTTSQSSSTSYGESQNHTHSVTASGTISGGAYSFSGSSGTTGTTGSGTALDIMPPYIAMYCWKRTA